MLSELRKKYPEWTWTATRGRGAKGGWMYCGSHPRRRPVTVFKATPYSWIVKPLGENNPRRWKLLEVWK